MNFLENKIFFVYSFFISPIVSLIFLLGGIGILKLQEKWRRNLIITAIVAGFLSYLSAVFAKLNMYMYIAMGDILSLPIMSKSEEEIALVERLFEKIQGDLFSVAIQYLIIITATVYFLTRPKVKEQFK